MIVNYIAAAEADMQSAQERVDHGFQVLRAYGWQSDQAHVVMSCNCRCKVVAAINRYIITVRGQPSANFFVVSIPLYFEMTPRPPMNATRTGGLSLGCGLTDFCDMPARSSYN